MQKQCVVDWLDMEREQLLSENRFSIISDFSYDWEEWLLPDHSLEYVSPACERISGYSAKEFLQDPDFITTIIHTEDRERYRLHTLTELQPQRQKAEITFRLIRKDGSLCWIWHQCQPVFSPNGTWLGRRTTNRDITVLKEAEQKITEHHQLFHSGPAVIFKWRAEEGWPVEYVTPNIQKIFGYDTEELLMGAVPFSVLVHPGDLQRVSDEVKSYSQSGQDVFEQQYRFIDSTGNIRWVYDKTNIVRAADGIITHYHGYILDISNQIEGEETLRQSEGRLRLALNMADLGYWTWDLSRKNLFVSEELCNILGLTFPFSRATLTLRNMLKLVIPEDRSQVVVFLKQMAERERGKTIEFRSRHANGHLLVLLAKCDAVSDEFGKIAGWQGVCQDITGMRLVESNLLISSQIFSHTIEGIVVTDREGVMQKVNPAAGRITGYEPADVLGKTPRVFKSDRHPLEFYEAMWQELFAKGFWRGEIWNRRKNGEIYPEWLSITAIKDTVGTVTGFIAVFHDMTKAKQKEETIRYQAFHDALTGLPNRSLLLDRLKVSLQQARRTGEKVAVVLLDLDHFKHINDSLGHTIGDLLLQQAAERIRLCVRDGDTVSRHGGDEFVIIQSCLADLDVAVNTVKHILKVFRSSFNIEGHELFVTVSVGISCFPEDGDSEDLLISNAGLAMYRAKSQGRDIYHLFTKVLNEKAARRHSLENRLRHALKNDEFAVYYQPKVSLREKNIIGFEALVRWHPALGTVISPFEFIPLAEETGLIIPIGKFVLESACRQARIWQDEGLALSVAVNISTVQFRQHDFLASVKSIVLASGLRPQSLELEITESLMMGDETRVIGYLWELKKMGIKLSVDDFGTGYSSLSYLKQLPIDTLKIDRSFIKDLPDDQEDAVIASTIISMAKNLGLSVVAEGVETLAQCHFLEERGCPYIQGYLVSPPVPVSEVNGLLHAPGKCWSLTSSANDPVHDGEN